MIRAVFVTAAVAAGCAVFAQGTDAAAPPAATRSGQIEAQRRAKAAALKPTKPSRLERILGLSSSVTSYTGTALLPGLHIVLGGLPTGSGFAGGPQYARHGLLKNQFTFRAASRWSTALYQLHELEGTFPHLAHDHAYVDLYAFRSDYTRLDYYGEGPNSKKSGRTDYRMERTGGLGTVAARPMPRLRIGGWGGYTFINVGPGTSSRLASTDAVYAPASTPGLDLQTNYAHGGPFAEYDYRDSRTLPRHGGDYLARYEWFADQRFDRFNFRRFSADVRQYIPFLNATHGFALRGRTELSYTDSGQVVPFYMQPVLGGGDELRGFRPFRFYDDNLILLQGEYRWDLMTGVDMAIFTDQGKVFHDHSQFNLHNLEGSYGFGFRFNNRETNVMRLDVGFSREGFQIWLKFGNLF